MDKDVIRRCNFKPYVDGPSFSLLVWDCHEVTPPNHIKLGYRLVMATPTPKGKIRTVLFHGEDFGCTRYTAIDSDDAVLGIMHFLTLKPGDTDAEYFTHYSTEQLKFAQEHGEALRALVDERYAKGDK